MFYVASEVGSWEGGKSGGGEGRAVRFHKYLATEQETLETFFFLRSDQMVEV